MNRILLPLILLPLAGCEILEEDITNRLIEITAPTDGARVAAGDVCFAWRGVEHASGYEFTIVSPSFEHAERIAADTVIYADSMSRNVRCTLSLDRGEYRWRVVPFNSAYTALSRRGYSSCRAAREGGRYRMRTRRRHPYRRLPRPVSENGDAANRNARKTHARIARTSPCGAFRKS